MIDSKIVLLHPLLFSIIFVIMPYTQYAGLIPPAQVVVPFVVICLFALFSYYLIIRVVKKAEVAVSVLSPLLIFFLSYGILHNFISILTSETKLHVPVLILATLVMLIILVIYIVKVLRAREVTIKNVNKSFFVIACGLIIFNIFSITMQSIATAKLIESSRMTGIPLPKHNDPLPDIYFVILDEYAAPSQMKSYFQYDMSPFVEYLSQNGFIVTEMQNVPSGSAASLEERLNMEAEKAPAPSSLLDRLLESMNVLNTPEEEQMIHIRNSKVIYYLKSMGYQFIHMGSWFPQTRYNQLADQNINCSSVQLTNELSNIILHNSALRLLINRYTLRHSYYYRKEVLCAFATLENIPIIAGKPKFIFAHIICPHLPYVFGANGEKLSLKAGEGWKNNKQLYLGQHIFITKKVKAFIDRKLSTSQAAPVIIIQADHGAKMDSTRSHQVFSAVYIPKYKGKPWPDATKSFNTFRLLFNELFGSNLAILQ